MKSAAIRAFNLYQPKKQVFLLNLFSERVLLFIYFFFFTETAIV